MNKRAAYRNEVKTRLRDEVYERLQAYKTVHGITSDAAALARVVEIALCGLVFGIPVQPIAGDAE